MPTDYGFGGQYICLIGQIFGNTLGMRFLLIRPHRRLSSGLGLAAGADERQLCIELPRHAAGFQSPVALAINVRIARVTDDIMSSESTWFLTQIASLMVSQKLSMEISPSRS